MMRSAMSFLGALCVLVSVGAAQVELTVPTESGQKASVELSAARAFEDLHHPDPLRRELATRRLIALGDSVLAAVKQHCSADDAALALRARRIHAAIRGVDPETDSALTEILDLSSTGKLDDLTAAGKIAALGSAARQAALERVSDRELRNAIFVHHEVARLATSDNLKDDAWRALAALGKEALPALRSLISDQENSRAVRVNALWLYGLNNTGSIGPITGCLTDSDSVVRREATRTIAAGFTGDDFFAVADALPAGESESRQRLALTASRIVDVAGLTNWLGADNRAAEFAAIALGERRSKEAYDALAAHVEGGSAPVREAVVTALGVVGIEDAVELLALRVCRDPEPTVRAAAVASLSHYRGSRLANVAIVAALADAAPTVRIQATDALVALGGDVVVPGLAHALHNDDDAAVKARALAGLQLLDPRDDRATAITGTVDDRFASVATLWQDRISREPDEETRKGLPWHEAGRDAARIITTVRDRITKDFFYFDKEELIDVQNLNKAALDAIKKVLERKGDDELESTGTELELLRDVLAADTKSPEALVQLLGVIPFEKAPTADLIRITNAAVKGMVGSLGDRFSRVQISNDAKGRPTPEWLPGLLDGSDTSNGFSVKQDGDSWTIEFVLFDSPAYHAGFRIGDRLIRVGDKLTSGLTRKEVSELLRTKNEFHILRDGWIRPYGFALEPVSVEDDERLVVSAILPGNIGYLRLAQFALGSSGKIESELRKLEAKGIKGLIFDLRNNPGGAVIDAIAIADKFTPEGKIICINLTRSGKDEVMKSTAPTSPREYPLVCLVNGSSASASEMTSGSLQGNERCRVIGTTSYGKGIGQNGGQVRGFASKTSLGESRSAYSLTLTMMRYFLPKDRRSIHHVGVEPDLVVRPLDMKGEAFDRFMTASHHQALAEYVAQLIEEDEDVALSLALEPGYDANNFPDLPTLAQTLGEGLTLDDVRKLVRNRLKHHFVREVNGDLLGRLLCDLEQDRVLRVAVKDVAKSAAIDLTQVPEAAILEIR